MRPPSSAGTKYVTVVIDREAKVVSHVADGRGREVLDDYFGAHPEAEREAVTSVTMDMWAPYIEATRDHIPDADTKIAFDKFHVAQHLGNAVDKVRRQEHRALHGEGDEQLNKTKYLWLRNPDNFTAAAWERFEPLRHSSLKTARAWAIKEFAMTLWAYRRRAWALRACGGAASGDPLASRAGQEGGADGGTASGKEFADQGGAAPGAAVTKSVNDDAKLRDGAGPAIRCSPWQPRPAARPGSSRSYHHKTVEASMKKVAEAGNWTASPSWSDSSFWHRHHSPVGRRFPSISPIRVSASSRTDRPEFKDSLVKVI